MGEPKGKKATKMAAGGGAGRKKQKKDKKHAPVPQQQRKKKVTNGIPVCPCYNAVSAFRFPVCFRSNAFSIAGGGSALGLFAPFNDCLGVIYNQAVQPPNASTAVTQTTLIDPFLTTMLQPTGTSGAQDNLSVRFTSYCVEFMVTDALSSVNSTLTLVRWVQSGVPLASSGAAPEFYSMYNSMNEHRGLVEVPCAQLTRTHCLHTCMQERSALEFTPVPTGSSAWTTGYGNTSGTSTTGSYNAPWVPIVGLLSSPNNVTVRMVIKATVEVVAPPNNFLSRLGKKLPTGGADAEGIWWRYCDRLRTSRLVMTQGLPGRTTAGYVGI